MAMVKCEECRVSVHDDDAITIATNVEERFFESWYCVTSFAIKQLLNAP